MAKRTASKGAELQGSLFDDEPAMRALTREQLIEAVILEMEEHPPVPSCAGDSAKAKATRRRLATRDVERIYYAADRLGATLQIVPIGKS